MNKVILVLVLTLVCSAIAVAQKGTAEPGSYPMNYSGDTWTGEVTATNDDTREIFLTYRKKDKEESFIGVLEQGYRVKMKDGSYHELKVSEIPVGTRIKVYYMRKDEKVGGEKKKINQIFQLRFLQKEDK